MTSTPPPSAFAFDPETDLASAAELLERLVEATASGQAADSAWDEVDRAAEAYGKAAEWAALLEALAGDRRKLSAVGKPVAAQLLQRAAQVAMFVRGDRAAADTLVERALREDPSNGGARAFALTRLEAESAAPSKRLADVLVDALRKDTQPADGALLERAAGVLGAHASTQKLAVTLMEDAQRKQFSLQNARVLAGLYRAAGRMPELARTLEQALAQIEPEQASEARAVREELLQVLSEHIHSPERALPLAEVLLQEDAGHAAARAVATALLGHKALQGRAALALATASAGFAFEEVRYLDVALESLRGAQRRDVLKRLATLRENPIADLRGAYDAYDAALALDGSDEQVRQPLVRLAHALGLAAEAARSLLRVAPSVRDAAVRAQVAVDTGGLLEAAGDRKKAKSTLTAALAMPEIDEATALRAAAQLAAIYESEGDVGNHMDMLSRMAAGEPDEARRAQAWLQLGGLAEQRHEIERGVAAYRELLAVDSQRAYALERLQALHEHAQQWRELAEVVAQRMPYLPDDETRRAYAVYGAQLLGEQVQDFAAARAAWEQALERFGPARDILAHYLYVLENQGDDEALDRALSQDIELTEASERGAGWARLASLRARREGHMPQALAALSEALRFDAQEPQARALAESLLNHQEAKVTVARLLAPLYRREQASAPLLRALEIIGHGSDEATERAMIWAEAAQLARQTESAKAPQLAALAVRAAEGPALSIQAAELASLLDALDVSASQRAELWSSAFADREIHDRPSFELACRSAESLERAGKVERATEVYRAAARFEPENQDLVRAIDRLLAQQGKPEERLALFEQSLATATDAVQRHGLYLQIASVYAGDLGQPERALSALESALKLVPSDVDALRTLLSLLHAQGELMQLADRVEASATQVAARERPGLWLSAIEALEALAQWDRAKHLAGAVLGSEHSAVEQLEQVTAFAERSGDRALWSRAMWTLAARTQDEAQRAQWLHAVALRSEDPAERRRAYEAAHAAAQSARQEAQGLAVLRDWAVAIEGGALGELEPGYADEPMTALIALHERQGEPHAAAERLDALVARSAAGTVRRERATRLAQLTAGELNDGGWALRSLLREIEAGDSHDSVLQLALGYAESGKQQDAMVRSLTSASDALGDDQVPAKQRLALTSARLLSRRAERFEDAVAAYESVLDLEPPQASEVLGELSRLVTEQLQHDAGARAAWRSLQRRRVRGADEEGRVPLLLEWAREEEAEAPTEALARFEEVLALAPEDATALAAVARVGQVVDAPERAASALDALRMQLSGDVRIERTLELALLRLQKLQQPAEALALAEEVLLQVPSEPALAPVLEQLSLQEALQPPLAAVIERGVDRALELADTEGAVALARWSLAHGLAEGEQGVSLLQKLADALQALGRLDAELEARVWLAERSPSGAAWDRAEELARDLQQPEPLTLAYPRVDYEALSQEDAERVGERAIAFFEEWYEDPSRLLPLLDRLFAVRATATLAFERLRLFYDTSERWDELFALYDRAIARADASERVQLLEEIARVAKDFAKNEAKAAEYYEALLDLRPNSASTEAALERLYERLGENEKLVALLSSQRAKLSGEAREANDRRVARLRAVALGDAAAALPLLEELAGPSEPAQSLDAELVELFEHVLQKASERVTRQRASQRLAAHYRLQGELDGLVRMLRAELEVEVERGAKATLWQELAQTELRAERPREALAALAARLQLEPDDEEALRELSDVAHEHQLVAEGVQHIAKLAEELPRARKAALRLSAAEQALREPTLARDAADLFRLVFDDKKVEREVRVRCAKALEHLYAAADEPHARLDVLERHATLESDDLARAAVFWEAGETARSVGERVRSVRAYEARLRLLPEDPGALDRLVEAYDASGSHAELARVLEQRAGLESARPEQATADLARAGELHGDTLNQPRHAVALFERIVAKDGPSVGVAYALASLYGALSLADERAAALQTATELAPAGEERAKLLAERGDHERLAMDNPAAALACYESALRDMPRNAAALNGLRALLVPPWRVQAADILLAALRQVDDTAGVLGLVEVRCEEASSDAERVQVLVEASSLEELRRGDAAAAFEYAKRAFLLQPAELELRERVQRLGFGTAQHEALREVYERALAAEPELPLEVHLELARLLEQPLDARGAALARFAHVYERDGSLREAALAVLRLGVEQQQMPWVAEGLGAFAVSEGKWQADVLAATEMYLQDGERVRALSVAIEQVAERLASAEPPNVHAAKMLFVQAARWASVAGDDARASELLRIGVRVDDEDVALLEELVSVERRLQNEALVDSLQRLSAARGGDLELLREATDHAFDGVNQVQLAQETAELLRRVALSQWLAPQPSEAAMRQARVARQRLESLWSAEARWSELVELLADDATKPWPREEQRELWLRAGACASAQLGDVPRALGYYEQLFAQDPTDLEVRARLRDVLGEQGDPAALAEYLGRELDATVEPEARARTRMQLAELEATAEGAEATLRQGLLENPRHPELVSALAQRLEQREQFEPLIELFLEQAERALHTGDAEVASSTEAARPRESVAPGRLRESLLPGKMRLRAPAQDARAASLLLLRAARIAEQHLGDPRRALVAVESAVRAHPSRESLGEAARLAAGLERFETAAFYLDKLNELEPSVATTLELARVFERQPNVARAIEVLEQGLHRFPESEVLLLPLAAHYRAQGHQAALAPLLERHFELSQDGEVQLQAALESAHLYTAVLREPPRALALLQRAAERHAGARDVRLAMADALGAVGRMDEAHALLDGELESYGMRRPKDRAPLHLHRARLFLIQQDEERALSELDTSTKIDPTFQPAVRELGELAERLGQYEKAERAYRALLSVVRRIESSRSTGAADDLSSTEVLLFLSRVATAKGEDVRGSEIFETALEAALDAPEEAKRLEQRLRSFGDRANLARVLQLRAKHHPIEALALGELAALELSELGDAPRAMATAQRAFGLEPTRQVGELLLTIASQLGQEQELAVQFEERTDALRLQGKLAAAARHASLLALLAMRDGRHEDAVRWIASNRDTSELSAEDAELLAEIRRAQGDAQGEAEALEWLLEQTKDPGKQRRGKLQLAKLLYQRAATLDEANRYLLEAREDGAALPELLELVGEAAADHPQHAGLLELYVQFAREVDEPRALATSLIRAWSTQQAELSFLDEAVAAARRAGDRALEERVLREVVDTAQLDGDNHALLFALRELSALLVEQGDVRSSLALRKRATEVASEAQRDELLRELAEFARERGELVLAAETYAQLFASDPRDTDVLAALIELYRETKQGERLASLLADLALASEEPTERLKLQLERLRVLEQDVRYTDAELVAPLRDIVTEAPDQHEVAERLLAILERSGAQGELGSVLGFLVDAALDRGIHERLGERAIRLAALRSEAGDGAQAIDVFERVLGVLPGDVALLRAFAEVLRKHGEYGRLEGVLEELGGHDEPHVAAQNAMELADLALGRGDVAAATAALERAVALDPNHHEALSQLEATYREAGEAQRLAALLQDTAERRGSVAAAVQALRDAAALFREPLQDADAAAQALVRASEQMPQDVALTLEAVDALLLAARRGEAAELLERRLQDAPLAAPEHLQLTDRMAEVLREEQPLRAVEAKEAAARGRNQGQLDEVYTQFVASLVDSVFDYEHRRALSFKLVHAYIELDQRDAARAALEQLLADEPESVDGLLALGALDEREGQLESALGNLLRALTLQKKEQSASLALRVAGLAEQLGRPDDARLALERVRLASPEDVEVRQRLEQMYEASGELRRLAEVSCELAQLSDDADLRFAYWLRAGSALLDSGEEIEQALDPLHSARELRPTDLDAAALLSDAYSMLGMVDEAEGVLRETLAGLKGRRSREIGTLYHRVARVAQARGDRTEELSALSTALEMDPQNGVAAMELSQLALELGELELAGRALRAITMLRGEPPMPRAYAYKQLGEIAWAQGDAKKASIMFKRALDDDPRLEEARELLAQIEGAR